MEHESRIEIHRAPLHPLDFPLSSLADLSSLQLALVQLHVDRDQPGFDEIVRTARYIWINRRLRALDQQQQRSDNCLPLLSLNRTTLASTVRTIEGKFAPLVTAVLMASGGGSQSLYMDVRRELVRAHPDSCPGDHPTFEAYLQAARRSCVVELRYLNDGHVAISLPRKGDAAMASAGSFSASTTPLTPFNMHTASLRFPLDLGDLATLASLSTAQLLLLQFRSDLPSKSSTKGGTLHGEVERLFLQRRSIGFSRGERWEAPALANDGFRTTRYLIAPTLSAYQLPAQPHTDEALPLVIGATFSTVEVPNFPAPIAKDVSMVASLLPPHLSSVAVTVRLAAGTLHSPYFRRVFFAFESPRAADRATTHLRSLRLPLLDGSAASLWAVRMPAGYTLDWRWGEVTPASQLIIWSRYCATNGWIAPKDAKAPSRYELELKAREPIEVKQIVLRAHQVPLNLVKSLFPAAIGYASAPPDLQLVGTCDDAFVHRFKAVAWATHPTLGGLYLLFDSKEHRATFLLWASRIAEAHWASFKLDSGIPDVSDALDVGWRFYDFAPTWRAKHGYAVPPAPLGADGRTVGELGEGNVPPPGAPDNWRVGLFPFELAPPEHSALVVSITPIAAPALDSSHTALDSSRAALAPCAAPNAVDPQATIISIATSSPGSEPHSTLDTLPTSSSAPQPSLITPVLSQDSTASASTLLDLDRPAFTSFFAVARLYRAPPRGKSEPLKPRMKASELNDIVDEDKAVEVVNTPLSSVDLVNNKKDDAPVALITEPPRAAPIASSSSGLQLQPTPVLVALTGPLALHAPSGDQTAVSKDGSDALAHPAASPPHTQVGQPICSVPLAMLPPPSPRPSHTQLPSSSSNRFDRSVPAHNSARSSPPPTVPSRTPSPARGPSLSHPTIEASPARGTSFSPPTSQASPPYGVRASLPLPSAAPHDPPANSAQPALPMRNERLKRARTSLPSSLVSCAPPSSSPSPVRPRSHAPRASFPPALISRGARSVPPSPSPARTVHRLPQRPVAFVPVCAPLFASPAPLVPPAQCTSFSTHSPPPPHQQAQRPPPACFEGWGW
ncbi:hypothetical protein JCM10450v2_002067 [Rhodotorula kratochvilovae]